MTPSDTTPLTWSYALHAVAIFWGIPLALYAAHLFRSRVRSWQATSRREQVNAATWKTSR